jgi:hypothetical protein
MDSLLGHSRAFDTKPSILKLNRWGAKGVLFVIATVVAVYRNFLE